MTTPSPPRPHLGLTPDQFTAAFPFHFAFDRGLRVLQVGPALRKPCPDLQPGRFLPDLMRVSRPEMALEDAALRAALGRLIIFEYLPTGLPLRGQLLAIEPPEGLLALCSPWITDADELTRFHLELEDFPNHDPVVDLLHAIQAQKATLADAKRLFARMTSQRSELRAANERLRQQEAEQRKLALVAARTDNAVIVTDARGNTEWVNEGFTRITGYALDEVVGRKPGAVLQGPETNPATIALIREAIGRGEGVSTEILNYHKSGRRYWLAIEIQPIRDEAGAITNFMAVERDVTDLRRSIQRRTIQYEVTRGLAEAGDLTAGLSATLASIGSTLGWDLGAFWQVDADASCLRCVGTWTRAEDRLASFLRESQARTFAEGVGLPGRVWRSQAPAWVTDVTRDDNFPRAADALACGLHGGLAFPILVDRCVWGVCEFFSRHIEEPDVDLLQLLSAIASQVAQFIERVRIRKDLEIQKALFERLFAESPVAVSLLDEHGAVREINAEFTRLFGYTAPEAIGRTLQGLIVPPDPVEHGETAAQAISRGERVSFEAIRRAKDGSLRAVVAIGQPVRLADGRPGVYALFLDVTARKRAEEALRQSERQLREANALQRAILESAEYSIISTALDGTIRTFNRAAERMLGYQAAELLDRATPALIHDPAEVAQRARELTAEVGRTIEPGFEVLVAKARLGTPEEREWTYVRKDGTRFPVLLSVSAELDDHGVLIGYLGIASDITERKRVAEELVRARDAADAASRAKSGFLAMMSHEIRTPMNSVLGMAALLADTPLTPVQREFVEAMRRGGESLLELINDVLDFSKIESEKLDLEPADFDLHDLLGGVLELLAHRAQAKGTELAAAVPRDVPRALRGDDGRLRQVLVNLVGNAIKFTDHGEVTLRAEALGPVAEGRARLRFSVSDTGIGISPEDQARLFSAFTQLESAADRRFGGTGLGLAISRRLVQLMGGDIRVTSAAGKGSTFSFDLDLVVRPSPLLALAPLPAVRSLLISPHPTTRESVTLLLESADCEVRTAPDQESALACLRQAVQQRRPIGIVLLDADLDPPPGYLLAQAIRAATRDHPVRLVRLVPIAGAAAAQVAPPGLHDATVTKPVRASPLFDCLAMLHGEGGPAPAGVAPGPGPAPLPEEVHQLRLLVAEDHDVNRRLALLMLEKLGCNADLACNGREVLEALERHEYDLILMDCQMPEMDGFMASRAIRTLEAAKPERRRVRIVALTANAMRGDRETCLAAGMDGYLTKPIRLEALADALRESTRVLPPRPRPPDDASLSEVHAALERLATDFDRETATELGRDFVRDARTRIDDLVSLADGTDPEEFARAAHSLAGSSSIFGLEPIRRLSLEIEGAARDDRRAEARRLARQLALDAPPLLAHLETLLEQASVPNETLTSHPGS